MSVDIEIYVSNIIKFFKDNPKDLTNLVPKGKEEEFYEKIREVAISNYEKEMEASLTQKQMIDICRELNGQTPKEIEIFDKVFHKTKFGFICLN
jgi:hypothetical protein